MYVHTSDGKPPSTHEIELIRRSNGIVTYTKHYVTVIGFTFRHMVTAGINFDVNSSNCMAIDNTSYGAWQGIRVSDSTNVLVQANTLFRNGNSGVYFLSASTNGYAVGNVLYENAKGARWSSGSANGLALDNTAFGNHEVGISIEESDDIRVSGNVMVGNVVAQLRIKKSRYLSQGNCFESRGTDQLIAKIDHSDRYETLASYQQATNQELGSRAVCGRLPRRTNVTKLHVETSAYAKRARKALAKKGDGRQRKSE